MFFTLSVYEAQSQCAVCKTSLTSLDDKSAKGLNGGIIYLAFMPLAIISFIGFKWWKHYKETI